ncbi:hypothetical protein KKC16_01400, partial [Patescibacteria group bacterium]|nr:hypothetical protein [Patescibacteria group bacterium]
MSSRIPISPLGLNRDDGIQLNKDQCYSTGSHRLDPILKSPIKTRDEKNNIQNYDHTNKKTCSKN